MVNRKSRSDDGVFEVFFHGPGRKESRYKPKPTNEFSTRDETTELGALGVPGAVKP